MVHSEFLLTALKLAEQRRGFCAPNPSVGAVLVKGNAIIAEGVHHAAGLDHAEVDACQHLADNSGGDLTLYVTLEPCCHWGRTPPCTELIIKKGIKKVYYGFSDPNPKVDGQGEAFLREQGVTCERINLTEINDFYKSYAHWVKTKKPWVTTKLAMSLDSKIADPASKPIKITGDMAQGFTHEWRRKSDAILTSAKTIINDNPSLNVRLPEGLYVKPLYILDSELTLPLTANIYSTTAKITVFHSKEDKHKIEALKALGVNCHSVPRTSSGLDLESILTKIGADGIQDLWVEAGGKLFSNFIIHNLAHKSLVYVAPKILGAGAHPAFSTELDIFDNAKNINWYTKGTDAICEIDWI